MLKHATVTPVVKNRNGGTESYQNYRPISNLCFVLKLLKKVVYEQIQGRITINNWQAKFQAGYRKHYSCETAIVEVVSWSETFSKMLMLPAVLLLLCWVFSAFDTIDHDIVVHMLHYDYALSGHVLKWIKSYLSGHSFSVCVNGIIGKKHKLFYGVPQGSLLGLLFYILYTKDLQIIVQNHNLSIQQYADNTQLFTSFSTKNFNDTNLKIKSCLSDIHQWMSKNPLKISHKKTDIVVFQTDCKCTENRLDINSMNLQKYWA